MLAPCYSFLYSQVEKFVPFFTFQFKLEVMWFKLMILIRKYGKTMKLQSFTSNQDEIDFLLGKIICRAQLNSQLERMRESEWLLSCSQLIICISTFKTWLSSSTKINWSFFLFCTFLRLSLCLLILFFLGSLLI